MARFYGRREISQTAGGRLQEFIHTAQHARTPWTNTVQGENNEIKKRPSGLFEIKGKEQRGLTPAAAKRQQPKGEG
jgi:hypothetical protein